MSDAALDALLREIRACTRCASALPLGPRPVVQAGASARLLIVGQAPGAKVHASGIPWDDASGRRLRDWLGVHADVFYDPARVAIVPMGFCYPGKRGSGDAPPRPECAPAWHAPLRAQLPHVRLTLAVGAYAQRALLGDAARDLTANVRGWRAFAPHLLPLPHPSPRNVAWFRANPWFEADVLPALRARVAAVLTG